MKEIRRIIQLYDQLKADGTAAALAVVVDVEASSYRRIGARLLVAADGRYVGGISGGCLEGDALRRARAAILAGQPSTHTYDTLDGEDAVIGIGLGCEGRIEVMFVPLEYTAADNEVEVLRQLVDIRQPTVLTRMLATGHQAPAQSQIFRRGDLAELAAHIQTSPENLRQLADAVLAAGRSSRQLVPGQQEASHYLLFEVIHPEIHLVVTGTNYDIPPTLRTARLLGWKTTVIGPRRKFTSELKTLADQLLDYSEAGYIQSDPATAVVLMSHDFDWDRKMAQHFIPRSPTYFGMLGPRKRAQKMHELLLADAGIDLLSYPGLYSPVGLDIGAETPEEIAASLVAEIIAVFRERNGQMLRQRKGSIHSS